MDQRSREDRRSGLTAPWNRATVTSGSERGNHHATDRKHDDHRRAVARCAERLRGKRRRSEGYAEGSRCRDVVDPHGQDQARRVPGPDQGHDLRRVRPFQRQGLVLLADRLLRGRRRRLCRLHVRRSERGAGRARVLPGEVDEPDRPYKAYVHVAATSTSVVCGLPSEDLRATKTIRWRPAGRLHGTVDRAPDTGWTT